MPLEDVPWSVTKRKICNNTLLFNFGKALKPDSVPFSLLRKHTSLIPALFWHFFDLCVHRPSHCEHVTTVALQEATQARPHIRKSTLSSRYLIRMAKHLKQYPSIGSTAHSRTASYALPGNCGGRKERSIEYVLYVLMERIQAA